MGMFFNGVMTSREAGSFMPSTPITKAEVSNCVINALKLDDGDKTIYKDINGNVSVKETVSDPENLPLLPNYAWSLKTVLYANFNGDLEAGQLSLYGDEIDSIAIRRSSNRTNFNYWEDILTIENVKEVIDQDSKYYFSDKAIESGVWYTYALQPIAGSRRGNLYKGVRRAIIFEHGFLVGDGGRQLKLKFNTAVSSIKRNLKETRVETIGGKYPFITRNANVNYKEFSLTGTITHFMDETEEFAPRAELFIDEAFSEDSFFDMTSAYKGLYSEYDINNYNNTVLEREFRKKVEEFLNDGKPKLFKSPNEGNLIVRIMDVNLTPNQTLGRLICDFSCTAVEIDEASLTNIQKYGIQER